ncbi:MAG: class I SAM-dependent methyltransferase [bacterium]|nr:class I SAM-dependent methyltransferase [bacterium]
MSRSSEPNHPVGPTVQAFYDELPFNHWGDVDAAAASIRTNVVQPQYPDLHELLQTGRVRRIVEFGCGAGWLTCTLAHHYDVEVVAVDFTARALTRAAELAAAVNVTDRVQWLHQNLFEALPPGPFDLVLSMGALHHTGDTRRAFEHVQRAAGPGDHVYVGLYHEPGRRVFLGLFDEFLQNDDEAGALAKFRELAGDRGSDEEHLRSWFRDQVLHPHETQHTLREVAAWLDAVGLELERTSINRFAPIDEVTPLFALEQEFAARSHEANVVERRYFPGFFTVLARRPASRPA